MDSAASKKSGGYVRFGIVVLACVNLIFDVEILINDGRSAFGSNNPFHMEQLQQLRKLFLEKYYSITVVLFIVNLVSLIFTLLLLAGALLKKSSMIVTYLLFVTALTAVYLLLISLSYHRLTKFNELEIYEYKEQAFICMRIAFKLVVLMFLVLIITWGYCVHSFDDIEEPVKTETSIDTSRVDPEIAPTPLSAIPSSYISGPQVPSAPFPNPYMTVYYNHRHHSPQAMDGHYNMDQAVQVKEMNGHNMNQAVQVKEMNGHNMNQALQVKEMNGHNIDQAVQVEIHN